jgi:hypothetical protein
VALAKILTPHHHRFETTNEQPKLHRKALTVETRCYHHELQRNRMITTKKVDN